MSSPGRVLLISAALSAAEVQVLFPKGKLPATQQTGLAPRWAPLEGQRSSKQRMAPCWAGGRHWLPREARVPPQREHRAPPGGSSGSPAVTNPPLQPPRPHRCGQLPHRATSRSTGPGGGTSRVVGVQGAGGDPQLQPEQVRAPSPCAVRWVL